MGQTTYAIMFGVRAPRTKKAGPLMYDDNAHDGWLLEACPHAFRPSYTSSCYVGFYVAVGASGKPGVPVMPHGVPLDEVAQRSPWKKAAERASKKWARFAAWAQKRGWTPRPATLLMVKTEVA